MFGLLWLFGLFWANIVPAKPSQQIPNTVRNCVTRRRIVWLLPQYESPRPFLVPKVVRTRCRVGCYSPAWSGSAAWVLKSGTVRAFWVPSIEHGGKADHQMNLGGAGGKCLDAVVSEDVKIPLCDGLNV